MTLQPIPSEFPHIWAAFLLLSWEGRRVGPVLYGLRSRWLSRLVFSFTALTLEKQAIFLPKIDSDILLGLL
jgi:hypothetical protein